MNKERELLKECRLILDTPFNGSTGINLRNRIAELLTQPEQTEQFPLPGERLIEMWRDGYDAGVRLAQPEHIPDVGNMVTQEPVVWCTEDYDSTLTNAGRAQHIIKYGSPPTYYPIPLYLNPQNSKCLDISKIVMPNSTPDPFEYRDGFEDGVEYAEKHHKIGCTG